MEAKKKNDERRAAIEAKRKRLEDLRKSKASKPVKEEHHEETSGLNNLIEELLGKPPAESASPPETPNPVVEIQKYVVVLDRVSDIGTICFPLKEEIGYSKHVQTDEIFDQDIISPRNHSRKSFEMVEPQEYVDVVSIEPVEEEVEELDDEEIERISKDKVFSSFLNQGVRVIERAMKQNSLFDVSIDYGGLDTSLQQRQEKATLAHSICHDRWSKDRTLTSIQFSPHHKELFLTSYSSRQVTTSEGAWAKEASSAQGLVLVWSMHMLAEGPEYIFTCDSSIHTVAFHPFSPNTILGGTYSGQIVMWDLRSKSIPIQRSLLSVESHTHPVYSMTITGSENAHNLVSLSTDGQLCLWAPGNISHPTESKQLRWEKKEVTAICLAFPSGETNEMCIGSEDGRIFKAQVHGSRSGVQSQIKAHQGPVTNIHFHKGSSMVADLLLSSSMDWKIKLWSNRVNDSPLATFATATDYVYDVQWSPVHPAVFASVDGSGNLDIWHLNVDIELPFARIQVTKGAAALSCLRWSLDGRRVFVGDSKGTLYIYDVTSEIHTPRKDEWTTFENLIANLIDQQETTSSEL